jgi:hypothetical protein
MIIAPHDERAAFRAYPGAPTVGVRPLDPLCDRSWARLRSAGHLGSPDPRPPARGNTGSRRERSSARPRGPSAAARLS